MRKYSVDGKMPGWVQEGQYYRFFRDALERTRPLGTGKVLEVVSRTEADTKALHWLADCVVQFTGVDGQRVIGRALILHFSRLGKRSTVR